MIAFDDRLRQNIDDGCFGVARAGGVRGSWIENRAPSFLPLIGRMAMAGRREDVDLQLVLKNPERARQYVEGFDWGLPDPPKYIVFGVEDKIWFNSMTDEQAVQAAFIILKDVEIPRAWRVKQLQFWEQ